MTPGRYAVQLLEPGQPEQISWARDVERLGQVPGVADRVIDLAEGGDVVRDFSIQRGCAVEGKVHAGGAPLAQASVALRPTRSPKPRGRVATAVAEGLARNVGTDGQGQFCLPHVKPGLYELTVRVQDGVLSYVALTRTVEIPAEETCRLDLAVPHASIRGRIRKPEGSSSRCLLRLARTDGGQPYVRSLAERDDGTYGFDHLAAGTYEIVVTPGPGTPAAVVSRRGIVVSPGCAHHGHRFRPAARRGHERGGGGRDREAHARGAGAGRTRRGRSPTPESCLRGAGPARTEDSP